MSEIEYEVIDQVAHVRLNRPDKHNGLTLPMLDGLTTAADRAAKDKSLRAVLIYGQGPSFCSGLDFGTVGKDRVGVAKTFVPNPLTGANSFQTPGWAWRSVPVPVIAVITGHCYGGGLQIALGADFRYAATDADLSILEAKWGLIPDMSLSMSIAQLTGIDIAKRLTMTGEMLTADYAKQVGLVSEVSDDPMAEAMEFIEVIKQRSPDAVAAAKELFERTWDQGPRSSFGTEQRLQLRMLRGYNSGIARKAGLKREKPEFRERQF